MVQGRADGSCVRSRFAYAAVVSSIAEVFPHDDPVARFVVAMSMARNDVRHAMERTAATNEGDAPEFTYYARLALGHFFEALDALDQWRRLPEVKRFIERMPQEGREQLQIARSTRQRVGHAAIKQIRNRTFHYPAPDSPYQTDAELREALRVMGPEEVTVVITGDGFYRLHFADQVALTVAMRRHTPDRFRTQASDTQAGAAAFVNFATVAWRTYMNERGLTGLPPPP